MKREGMSKIGNAKKKNKKSISHKRTTLKKLTDFGKIRLNKLIANSGICSRRDADKFIAAGIVTVNGKGITKMGVKVSTTDVVKFNGVRLKSDTHRYVLLNKPKNYSGRADSSIKNNTIMRLIQGACKEHVFPVDKLNKMETGLLLFTNDTSLAKKISSNKQKIKAIYQITLDKKLDHTDFKKIKKGISINGKTSAFDAISYVNRKEKNMIGVENSTGGIKFIKQIFEKFGYQIKKLDRVFLGGLTKRNLPRKQFRHLTQEEIHIL